MPKEISRWKKRKATNHIADAIYAKITKRYIRKRAREAAAEKVLFPGDILRITITLDASYVFPDKRGK